MTDLLVFPDAALVAITHVRDGFEARDNPATVGKRVPNPRPDDGFIQIQRTGGPRLNIVADNPQLTIESWHPDDGTAHDNAQLARSLIFAMRGEVVAGVTVYRIVDVGGIQDFPDPLSDQPRYTMTVQVAMRGEKEPAGS